MGFITPSSKPLHALESLISVRSFFTPLLLELPASSSSNEVSIQDDPEFIYRTWLRSKIDEFVLSLIHFSVSPLSDETLREEVVDSLMECVKDGNGGKFHSSIFHKFIHSIVYSSSGDDNLLNFLFSKYFKYIDVRYFTFISLEKLAQSLDIKDSSDGKNAGKDTGNESQSKASVELSIYKIHLMLSNIPPLEKLDKNGEYEMWNGSFHQRSKERVKKIRSARSKSLAAM